MRRILLVLLLGFLTISGFSQRPKLKFGKLPIEDLKLSVYEQDSSAKAVYLADLNAVKFFYHQGLFIKRLRK
ncbi:hypothetical protein FUAX_22100 [Fulvitalea axinellae]|uniref:Uncharacterized protein n=1 Tax=Fulvitalea axinellae TaxID=1182444 RepID=A0AAU9CI98_9BACT|nr:hypothetical protein FUAX_22100 [Fulvitalea axinellae]